MLEVGPNITIPEEELETVAARSSGPGGQNVNKVNTQITLWFDLANSAALTPEQKELVWRRLGSRINKDGRLQVVSSESRSQLANRQAARDRLAAMLADALTPRKPRRKTRTPAGARQRRLDEKRKRARTKQHRSRPDRGSDW